MDDFTFEDNDGEIRSLETAEDLDKLDNFTDTPELEVIVAQIREYRVPPDEDLKKLCDESTLLNKQLAYEILKWALEPVSHIPEFNNRSNFRGLKCQSKNMTILKTVQLLAVFMYGYGSINAVPRNKDEKRIIDYRRKAPKRFVYWRARRFVRFLSSNQEFFKETQMHSDELPLLFGNLYDLLDGYKTLIKKEGLFDPSGPDTFHTKNCSGMFWGHYYKINQVVDCLRDAAMETQLQYLSSANKKLLLENRGILYETEETMVTKALEARVEKLGRTAGKAPQSTPRKRGTPSRGTPSKPLPTTKRPKANEENMCPEIRSETAIYRV